MSIDSMKNKRELSRIETYKRILTATRYMVVRYGILKISTLEIARRAGVAHGTIFSHFGNKNELFVKLFKEETRKIKEKLNVFACDKDIRLKELLNNYLNALIEDERLHTIMAKEFPFYHEDIQKEIIQLENIIKEMVFLKINEGINKGIFANVNVTMAISYFWGTINYYLTRKETFTKKGNSILNEKKEEIINTFFQILTIQYENNEQIL